MQKMRATMPSLAQWAAAGMLAGCAAGPQARVMAPTTPDDPVPRSHARAVVPGLGAITDSPQTAPADEGIEICAVTPDACGCPVNPPCPTKSSCSAKSSCSGKAACAGHP